MKNSTVYTILWFLFLVVLGIFSLFKSKTIKNYTVLVGPHITYSWFDDNTSTLQGDGKTHLYLKSESGNFTIYDQDELYVVSGQPLEMQPGDTKQAFTADFETQSGYQYTLSDNSADIYTLDQAELHFSTQRYRFIIPLVFCIVLFFLTLAVL